MGAHYCKVSRSPPVRTLAASHIAELRTPQELTIDAISPIHKHGRMVQETAVQAQRTALARAGGGMPPLSHPRAEPRDHHPTARIGRRDAGVSEFNRPTDPSSHSNRNRSRVECNASSRKQKTAPHSTRHSRRGVVGRSFSAAASPFRKSVLRRRAKNYCRVFVDRNCFIAYTLRLSLQGKV